MTIHHAASSLSSPASEVEINHPTVVSHEGTWYPLLMEQKHDNLIRLGGCECCPCSWGFQSRSRKKGGHPACSRSVYPSAEKGLTLKWVYPAWGFGIYASALVFMTILSHVGGNRAKQHSGGSPASENLTSPPHGVECILRSGQPHFMSTFNGSYVVNYIQFYICWNRLVIVCFFLFLAEKNRAA